MGVLWPSQPTPRHPSGLARLGRVLHWLALLAALGCAGLASIWVREGYGVEAGWLGAGIAVGVAMAGRALRYVLAGE